MAPNAQVGSFGGSGRGVADLPTKAAAEKTKSKWKKKPEKKVLKRASRLALQ